MKKIVDFFKLNALLIPPSSRVPEQPELTQHSPWKFRAMDEETASDEKEEGKEAIPTKSTGEQINDWRENLKFVSTYWSPYWLGGLVAGVGLMAMPLGTLIIANVTGTIIDYALLPDGLPKALRAVKYFGIAIPFLLSAMLVSEHLAARLGSRVINDIRYDLLEKLQKLSINYHDEAKLGDLVARFSVDMEHIEEGIGRDSIATMADIGLLIISLIYIFYKSFWMTVLTLIPLLLFLYGVYLITVRYAKVGMIMQRQKALVIDATQEIIRGQAMIKSFGLENFLQGCFSEQLKVLEDKNTKAIYTRELFRNTMDLNMFILRLISLGLGSFLIANHSITPGAFISFIAASSTLYTRLYTFSNRRMPTWVKASVGIRRLNEVLNTTNIVHDTEEANDLESFNQEIKFNNVSFSYTENELQLKNINLAIKTNQFVAFVGPSGAGKSTIANLLMRFYDVKEGSITIDGSDVREVTQASLRKQMSVVLQDTFLFNTTIFDNIQVVKLEATHEEVIEAAKSAELHDFIMSLPAGYDTIVGEDGSCLSGGQKQRIAIARAVLCNRLIWLLDESTSNLDPTTAQAINTTLSKLTCNHTIIVITHQLSSVTSADKIFVLRDGCLVEEGVHKTLLDKQGAYSRLWESHGLVHHG